MLGKDLRVPEDLCDVTSGLASAAAGAQWLVRVYWCSPCAWPGTAETVGLVAVGRTRPTTGSLLDGILLICLAVLPLGTGCLDSEVSLEME